MTHAEFKELLEKPEGTVLDFKSDMYDFKNDRDRKVTSNFVKDIISMTNTVRVQNSYIILGVREGEKNQNEMLGISSSIDDAILQDKIKDKVIPRPKFSYSTIHYEGKDYGIIEIPIEKYEMPITPTVNDLKGLEAGQVYYRNGSSNTEAKAYEVIRISKWMESLQSSVDTNNLNQIISDYIVEVTKDEAKLSTIISGLYPISKKYKLQELQKFCEAELKGFDDKEYGHDYRLQNVIFSYNKVDINPYSFRQATPDLIKQEMEESDGFFRGNLAMHHPLIEVEDFFMRMVNDSSTGFALLKTPSKQLGFEKDFIMYIYIFPDNFRNLYRNIRQKTIDLLMEI